MSRFLSMVAIIAISIQLPAQTQSAKERQVDIVISTAKTFVGTPYLYGGMSRKGIDCSGLVVESFKAAGQNVPRTSEAQSEFGKKIKIDKVRPGDLVFFEFKEKGEKWWHSGLIVSVEKGSIKFVHASSSRGVVESDLMSDYYRNNIRAFRRFI